MGAVHFGLDERVVRFFKGLLPLEVFVETGTYRGDTLAALTDLFDHLYSVELSPELHADAVERFRPQGNVHLGLGDSPLFIAESRGLWEGKGVLFWLDAHWCEGEATAGVESQCPLIGELTAIDRLHPDSVIIIDDARLFVSPPPGEHVPDHWPGLDRVVDTLRTLGGDHRTTIIDDTIVFHPRRLAAEFDALCRRIGADVLTAWDKARGYDRLMEQLEGKEAAIMDHARQLEEKEAVIMDQARQLEEKEALIQEQARRLAEG